jgi:hypothetical protein
MGNNIIRMSTHRKEEVRADLQTALSFTTPEENVRFKY